MTICGCGKSHDPDQSCPTPSTPERRKDENLRVRQCYHLLKEYARTAPEDTRLEAALEAWIEAVREPVEVEGPPVFEVDGCRTIEREDLDGVGEYSV